MTKLAIENPVALISGLTLLILIYHTILILSVINLDNNLDNNEKREKELDETESPLKMDTDKVTVENSGVLSFDQVKDIICYYNMNNTDKQSEFLFQNKEREIFEMNYFVYLIYKYNGVSS